MEVTPLASVSLVDSLELGAGDGAEDGAATETPREQTGAAEQKEELEEEQRTARADEQTDIDDVRHLK